MADLIGVDHPPVAFFAADIPPLMVAELKARIRRFSNGATLRRPACWRDWP